VNNWLENFDERTVTLAKKTVPGRLDYMLKEVIEQILTGRRKGVPHPRAPLSLTDGQRASIDSLRRTLEAQDPEMTFGGDTICLWGTKLTILPRLIGKDHLAE
jgi:hypothetical protein